jgi:hypothetical protein
MKEETQLTKDLTPVEWLAMELRHCIEINNIPISPKLLNILEEQAKEMEKEQHQETFKQSRSANIFKENMTPAWESWEEYYKVTFKQQEQ